MDIYQERLMDYYRHPRNRGKLEQPDFLHDEHNPSCGDSVAISGLLSGNSIEKLMFEGRGCVISQAVASMITEHCTDKTIEYVLSLTSDVAVQMAGIPLGPTRRKCAVLALQALQIALKKTVQNA